VFLPKPGVFAGPLVWVSRFQVGLAAFRTGCYDLAPVSILESDQR
jgi:hypothetical protein